MSTFFITSLIIIVGIKVSETTWLALIPCFAVSLWVEFIYQWWKDERYIR